MSLEQLQQATLRYLKEILVDESETFCRDLSDLVEALIENGSFDQVKVDMEPFLQERTQQFMDWYFYLHANCLKLSSLVRLKTYLTATGYFDQYAIVCNSFRPCSLRRMRVEKSGATSASATESMHQTEVRAQGRSIAKPREVARRLVSDDAASQAPFGTTESRANRLKRFGLPMYGSIVIILSVVLLRYYYALSFLFIAIVFFCYCRAFYLTPGRKRRPHLKSHCLAAKTGRVG
jgi:hypothetical protein